MISYHIPYFRYLLSLVVMVAINAVAMTDQIAHPAHDYTNFRAKLPDAEPDNCPDIDQNRFYLTGVQPPVPFPIEAQGFLAPDAGLPEYDHPLLELIAEKSKHRPYQLWLDVNLSDPDRVYLFAELDEEWYQQNEWLEHDVLLLQIPRDNQIHSSIIKSSADSLHIINLTGQKQSDIPGLSPDIIEGWRWRTVHRNACGQLVTRISTPRGVYEIPLKAHKIQQSLLFVLWVSAFLLNECPQFTMGWNTAGALLLTEHVREKTIDDEPSDGVGDTTKAKSEKKVDTKCRKEERKKSETLKTVEPFTGKTDLRQNPAEAYPVQKTVAPEDEERRLKRVRILCNSPNPNQSELISILNENPQLTKESKDGVSLIQIAAEAHSPAAGPLMDRGARLLTTGKESVSIHPPAIIFFLSEGWNKSPDIQNQAFAQVHQQAEEDHIIMGEWLLRTCDGQNYEEYIKTQYGDYKLDKLKSYWSASPESPVETGQQREAPSGRSTESESSDSKSYLSAESGSSDKLERTKPPEKAVAIHREQAAAAAAADNNLNDPFTELLSQHIKLMTEKKRSTTIQPAPLEIRPSVLVESTAHKKELKDLKEKISELKAELDDKNKEVGKQNTRINDLEVRVHTLTAGAEEDLTEEELQNSRYSDLGRLKAHYIKQQKINKALGKYSIEAKHSASQSSIKLDKVKEDLIRERHYNELTRKSMISDMERTLMILTEKEGLTRAKREVTDREVNRRVREALRKMPHSTEQFHWNPPVITLKIPDGMPPRIHQWAVNQWLELPDDRSEEQHYDWLVFKWEEGNHPIKKLELTDSSNSVHMPVIQEMLHYIHEESKTKSVSEFVRLIQLQPEEPFQLNQKLIERVLGIAESEQRSGFEKTALTVEKRHSIRVSLEQSVLEGLIMAVYHYAAGVPDVIPDSIETLRNTLFPEYSSIQSLIEPSIEETLAAAWLIQPLMNALESGHKLNDISDSEYIKGLLESFLAIKPSKRFLEVFIKDPAATEEDEKYSSDMPRSWNQPDYTPVLCYWLNQVIHLIHNTELKLMKGELSDEDRIKDFEDTVKSSRRQTQEQLVGVLMGSLEIPVRNQLMKAVDDITDITNHRGFPPLQAWLTELARKPDKSTHSLGTHSLSTYFEPLMEGIINGRALLHILHSFSTDPEKMVQQMTLYALMDFLAVSMEEARQISNKLGWLPLEIPIPSKSKEKYKGMVKDEFLKVLSGFFWNTEHKVMRRSRENDSPVTLIERQQLKKGASDAGIETSIITEDDALNWLYEKYRQWLSLKGEMHELTPLLPALEAWLELPFNYKELEKEGVNSILTQLEDALVNSGRQLQIQPDISYLITAIKENRIIQPLPSIFQTDAWSHSYQGGNGFKELNEYVKSRIEFYKSMEKEGAMVREILNHPVKAKALERFSREGFYHIND